MCVENLEWQRCVDLYDRPETFFFLDPPYTGCGRTAYDPWTETDVQVLRDRLAAIKGKWLVTLNDAPAIRQIFHGCRLHPIERALGINSKNGGKTYRELIITPA